MGLALLLCVHVHSKWAPAFLGCLPSGIMRLPHCAPISGLRGELDQKQASSATSSSCPADVGQMPRSCSAGSLGHWEPGRHRIQHEVVRPLGRARRTSWKAAPPLSPPLLCSLSGADSSAAAVVQCFHLSPDHLAWKSHREPSGATGSSAQRPRPPNLPAG